MGSLIWQQDNACGHTSKIVKECYLNGHAEPQTSSFKYLLPSMVPLYLTKGDSISTYLTPNFHSSTPFNVGPFFSFSFSDV